MGPFETLCTSLGKRDLIVLEPGRPEVVPIAIALLGLNGGQPQFEVGSFDEIEEFARESRDLPRAVIALGFEEIHESRVGARYSKFGEERAFFSVIGGAGSSDWAPFEMLAVHKSLGQARGFLHSQLAHRQSKLRAYLMSDFTIPSLQLLYDDGFDMPTTRAILKGTVIELSNQRPLPRVLESAIRLIKTLKELDRLRPGNRGGVPTLSGEVLSSTLTHTELTLLSDLICERYKAVRVPSEFVSNGDEPVSIEQAMIDYKLAERRMGVLVLAAEFKRYGCGLVERVGQVLEIEDSGYSLVPGVVNIPESLLRAPEDQIVKALRAL